MKRGLFAGMVVLLSGIAASAALIPTGMTLVYIDGKPYACFLFNGQLIDAEISTIPTPYIGPITWPEMTEPFAVDWANIPDLSLDTLVIGLGQYEYPDIDTLPGYNQFVYVPELGELRFLGIPEPTSFLFLAAGCWACRKKARGEAIHL